MYSSLHHALATPRTVAAHAKRNGTHARLACAQGLRRLRKAFDQLVAIDFFAGEAQRQTAAALQALEAVTGDDQWLLAAAGVFEGLRVAFEKEPIA